MKSSFTTMTRGWLGTQVDLKPQNSSSELIGGPAFMHTSPHMFVDVNSVNAPNPSLPNLLGLCPQTLYQTTTGRSSLLTSSLNSPLATGMMPSWSLSTAIQK